MSECLDPTLLQFLIENLPIGIMVTDSQGCMVKVNAHHANMTGHPRETLIGRPFSDVVAEGGANASCSMRVIETGLPMVFEQTVSPGKPDEKEIIVKCIPMHDENGVLQYVVNYLLDISDKNLLINQLRKVQFNNERYRMELKQFRTQESRTNKFIYRSTAMNALLEKAEKIAATDSTVLLTGDSGTGKSLLAKHIHNHSHRNENIFFSINCGAIPQNLMESELFGYEKGAFSGANSSGKRGVFEYVNGGTLFLDEIGEMPYDLQVKLLGVLQDSEFCRIGGTTPIKADVRIIAATNANLLEKIASNQFRLDLFYRLNVLSFTIPPLRERPEDIPVLVEHFANKINRKFGTNKKFAPEAIEQLMHLPLYGNVRELENLVERNILFALSDTITELEMLEMPPFSPHIPTWTVTTAPPTRTSGKEESISLEKQELLDAAKRFKTTTAMAKYFNVNQSTISRRLHKHHINLKSFR